MSSGQFRLLSVITVTYNSSPFVSAALRSAQTAAERAGLDVEFVIIDNASTDGSVETVRQTVESAHVVHNAVNTGFASANNQAFALARGDLWLLLNPDATLHRECLVSLVRFLSEHSDTAAVAPSIPAPWGGGPECGGMAPGIRSMIGHYFLVNRLLRDDRGGPWRGVMLQRRPRLGPREVEWLSGAVLLCRPLALRQVDGFDPTFFLYSEDVELGDRLRNAGWRLWLVPQGTASHIRAGSQGRVTDRWVQAAHDHYASRATAPSVLVYDLLLAFGLSGRALAWRARSRSREEQLHAETMLVSARRAWRVTARTFTQLCRRSSGISG